MRQIMKRQLIYHTPIALDAQSYKASEASVLSGQGVHERATIKTISRDGICLNCDQETLHRLLPNTPSVSPKCPVKIEVAFKLESFLQIDADVICIRRLSKDTFQLELRFGALDTEAECEIDAYIEHSLYKEKSKIVQPIRTMNEYSAVA